MYNFDPYNVFLAIAANIQVTSRVTFMQLDAFIQSALHCIQYIVFNQFMRMSFIGQVCLHMRIFYSDRSSTVQQNDSDRTTKEQYTHRQCTK